MKGFVTFASAMLLTCCGQVALAQQATLLLYEDGQHSLARADASGIHPVTQLGDRTSYSAVGNVMGAVSRRDDRYVFDVIDMDTLRITRSWPVTGEPTRALAGPTQNLVLTATHAYFTTVRFGPDGYQIQPNELGGTFDFHQLSLADGAQQTFPLPDSCVNPRLVDDAGTPLIYSWNGAGVWKFTGKVEPLVTRSDIEDTIVSSAGSSRAVRPGAFNDYVLVPGKGLFRLSKLGGLRQILGAKLDHRPASKTVDVGAGGDVKRVFAGRFGGQPAIGLLHQGSRNEIVYVDAASLAVKARLPVLNSVVAHSVLPASDGAVLYVDRDTGGILLATTEGSTELWNLKRLAPDSSLYDARILTFTAEP